MPRPPRFDIPGYPQHVRVRGNNRQPLFTQLSDYSYYLKLLLDTSRQHDCDIHCYVLMTNHVHLLVTPNIRNKLPKLIQSTNCRYVHYFNKRYDRTGTLFEGRYWASLVDNDNYVLACYRYIELNPVRANIVQDPFEYLASSYRHNAFAEPDPIITEHPTYAALADSPDGRLARYRHFVNQKPDGEEFRFIANAVRSGRVVGSDLFVKKISEIVARDVDAPKRGRPFRNTWQ